MGFARESFGGGAVAPASARAAELTPTVFGAGAGRAADAFAVESTDLGGRTALLADHDTDADHQLRDALAAAGTGRDRMDAVIEAAVADVTAIGASTDTPEGRRALIAAIKRHLEDTATTLDGAGADAATRAASSAATAAVYDGIGRPPGPPPLLPTATAPPPSLPMPGPLAMPALPTAGTPGAGFPLGALTGLPGLLTGAAHPPPATSTPTGPTASTASTASTAAIGDGGRGAQVVKRALGQLGVPYSWGGGGVDGPSRGSDGVGFDCSGLVRYAVAGEGVEVPRTTYELQHAGVRVAPEQARPGDIVLCNYSSPGVPEHVQIVMSGTQTVEAPTRGSTVRIGPWPSGHFEIRRLM